jgi:methionine-rich copper-binding protein CopC
MRTSRFRNSLLLLAAGVLLVAAVPPPDSAVPHFGLRTSAPEADATVSALDEVRLTFTEVPQENSVSIRVVSPDGEALETGDVRSAPDDGRIVFVTVPGTVPDGAYTVAWRGIGDDGHVVRGEFGFTVSAQR